MKPHTDWNRWPYRVSLIMQMIKFHEKPTSSWTGGTHQADVSNLRQIWNTRTEQTSEEVVGEVGGV